MIFDESDIRNNLPLAGKKSRRPSVWLVSILAASWTGMPGSAYGDTQDLLCDAGGMASISFGQLIDHRQATFDERTLSGITYFVVEPSIDISPFETLIVGVSPVSKKVFSIRMEMHSDADELDRIIEKFKVALDAAHPDLVWSVHGNHHYGERLTDLDIALYRIGTSRGGEATFFLSYDCDSRRHTRDALREN